MPKSSSDFQGEVLVASSIVDHLSSGLYESPAACLKELVNNAFDADATRVKVFVKPDADQIIIDDDGAGLTREQFISHFSRVSESAKRDVSDITPGGRSKIGLIGIGFIAANEICEEMEIFSTVKGSIELLRVTIDFRAMRLTQSERKRAGTDVAKGDYRGTIETAERSDHFTRIFLREIRGPAREMLAGAHKARGLEELGESLYGLSESTISSRLLKDNLRTWSQLDFYSRTMLEVGLNVPVKYPTKWVPESHIKLARPFEDHVKSLNFSVFYDGTDLRKPSVLEPGPGKSLFQSITIEGEEVSATGYLYAKRTTLHPEELNGILIRIRDAAVGKYDSTFLEFPKSVNPLFQRWITGEIWADDRLESAMNIDRRTLREAHPAFAELQSRFHQEFSSFLVKVRDELHSQPAAMRREVVAQTEFDQISSIVRDSALHISSTAKARVVDAWQEAETAADIRKILRKFSVSEVYEIAIDVAADILNPSDLERFVGELTRRLRG